MPFDKIKITGNFCSKTLDKWDEKLVNKLNDTHYKRELATLAVPYVLGITALSIASVVAPLFDAFINFGLKMHQPKQHESRVKIGLEFPEQLARKVGTCAKNAVLLAVTPIRVVRDLGYTLHRIVTK